MDLQVNASARIAEIDSEKVIVSSCKKNDEFEVVYEDGERYIGRLENSLPQGFGKIINKNGNYSVGNLINGKYNGPVKAYFRHGILFIDGNCKDGLLHGKTKIFNESGTLAFSGNFSFGKADGLGSLFIDYKKVTGYFKEGMINGLCVIHFIEGKFKIAGKFHYNKLNQRCEAVFIKNKCCIFIGSLNDGCTPHYGHLLVNSNLDIDENYKVIKTPYFVSSFNNGEKKLICINKLLMKTDDNSFDHVSWKINGLIEISKKCGFAPSSEDLLKVYGEYINCLEKKTNEPNYLVSKNGTSENPSNNQSITFENSLPLINENNSEQKQNKTNKNNFLQINDRYKPKYRTLDGHFVRSRGEVMIDDWLYSNKIAHEYEKRLPLSETVYCDFFLPDFSLYIEYWGLDSEEYNIRKEEKKLLYEKYKFNLLEITNDDIFDLDRSIRSKLENFAP